jgi:GMP synthase (glutamine-hydrolysing)
MTQPRLKSKLIINAAVRLCSENGLLATVVQLGDPDAGAIYLKVSGLNRDCVIFTQQRTADEKLGWVKVSGEMAIHEEEADEYLGRQIKYDNDIWILEIEDQKYRNPFA